MRGTEGNCCKGSITSGWRRREGHCGLAPELHRGHGIRLGQETMEVGGHFWQGQRHN